MKPWQYIFELVARQEGQAPLQNIDESVDVSLNVDIPQQVLSAKYHFYLFAPIFHPCQQ